MADPTGGSQSALITVIVSVCGAISAVGAVIIAVFRKQPDDVAQALAVEVKDVMLDVRADALTSHDADYLAQTKRVHQLEAWCISHGLGLPPRENP